LNLKPRNKWEPKGVKSHYFGEDLDDLGVKSHYFGEDLD